MDCSLPGSSVLGILQARILGEAGKEPLGFWHFAFSHERSWGLKQGSYHWGGGLGWCWLLWGDQLMEMAEMW